MHLLTIRSRQDFLRTQKNAAKTVHTKNIIILKKKSPEKYLEVTNEKRAEEFIRLGLVVSKKIDKKAVTRNKVKRRFREAFKKLVK